MLKAIKLFIADDHQLFIDGIKALLSDIPHLQILGDANNGNQVLEQLPKLEIDVILLDIGMPELSGIETATIITQKYPHIKILALTSYDDTSRISKMLKAGVKGYILKNTSKAELVQAIDLVFAGNTYYSPQVSANVMKEMVGGNLNENPLSKLTKREIEIIKLIAKSLTNKEIAQQLFLSELTVNTHRKNAMQKLELKNTASLVKFVIDNNLTDL